MWRWLKAFASIIGIHLGLGIWLEIGIIISTRHKYLARIKPPEFFLSLHFD
jgi:hypothetical protein